MSISYVPQCDCCRSKGDSLASRVSPEKARGFAERAGWTCEGGKDLCPKCSESSRLARTDPFLRALLDAARKETAP